MGKSLSICTAIYNIDEKFLRECIESLIADKSEDVEIIFGRRLLKKQRRGNMRGVCGKRQPHKIYPPRKKRRRKRNAKYDD